MYNIFSSVVGMIWLFDIFNFKFVEILDTTYPINFWAWVIIWICVIGGELGEVENRKDKER